MKDFDYIFFIGRMHRDSRYIERCFPTANSLSDTEWRKNVVFQFIDFDLLLENILLKRKEDFANFTEAEKIPIEKKYFSPLFENICGEKLEEVVQICGSETIKKYKEFVFLLAEEELNSVQERQSQTKIIFCRNALFRGELFLNAKFVIVADDGAGWKIFDKIFHRRIFSEKYMATNLKSLLVSAKKSESVIFKISRGCNLVSNVTKCIKTICVLKKEKYQQQFFGIYLGEKLFSAQESALKKSRQKPMYIYFVYPISILILILSFLISFPIWTFFAIVLAPFLIAAEIAEHNRTLETI